MYKCASKIAIYILKLYILYLFCLNFYLKRGEIIIEFLICLILVLIIALKFSENLRKNSNVYYFSSFIIAILDIIYRVFLTSKFKLPTLVAYIEKPIMIGALSGAIFVVVMYAGALDNKKNYTKKMVSVRAQLSILASIFFLPHTIPNCIAFFKIISKMDMSLLSTKIYVFLSLSAIISFIVIIPLWITSYKSIRKKMNTKKWKNLQRWAYLVYFLIYVHISILFLATAKKQYDKFIIYTVVFGIYTYLRIKKYHTLKKMKSKWKVKNNIWKNI